MYIQNLYYQQPHVNEAGAVEKRLVKQSRGGETKMKIDDEWIYIHLLLRNIH